MVKVEMKMKKNSKIIKIRKILTINMKTKNVSPKMMKNKQIYRNNLANSGMQSVWKPKSKNKLANN